jgi:bla regulator protein blaR1
MACLSPAAPALAAQVSAAPLAQPPYTPAWQRAAGTKMAFEAASIHVAEPGPFLPPSFELGIEDTAVPPGGRFFASFALEDYIEFAYKVMPTPEQREVLLAALPRWAKTQYFVIQAEAPGDPTKDQMRLMMQALLADRFHLRVHFETRIEPVLALVLVRPGRLGSGIRPHSQGLACDAQWTSPLDRTAPTVPPGGLARSCGSFDGLEGPNHTWVASARNATLEQLAQYLPYMEEFGRPVVDQTGLSGRFDFTLQWTPERRRPAGDGDSATPESTGTSPVEALKEQLGLKLQSTKAPVQILVIDHVEPPSPN